ncbi:hypothetical protein DPMN_041394 [Dreissena polymorpha]|uniref:Uncharacterized protein n=1 Tax=Dreissena polymorpha TaxID=45954 RepID=A0A9D4HW20_DREPO|nr:hypothetical protein DPMN_041394 [Dreissena polymorpha]
MTAMTYDTDTTKKITTTYDTVKIETMTTTYDTDMTEKTTYDTGNSETMTTTNDTEKTTTIYDTYRTKTYDTDNTKLTGEESPVEAGIRLESVICKECFNINFSICFV